MVCACASVAGTAVAEDAECTKNDIRHRAYKNAGSNKTQDTVRSFERELELCKGKVDTMDHLWTLIFIVRTYLENHPPDFDGCRRVAERGLRLHEDSGPSEEINDSFGYCGGDCSKAACVTCCEVGAKKRKGEIEDDVRRAKDRDRTVEDYDSEQAVSCDFKKARQLISGLDKAAFGDSALRLIAKYRKTCGKEIGPDVAEALANDEAMVNYHRGDDASCLKVVSGLPALDSPSTAFNRALCGGACGLDAARCATALEARKRTLAARAVQAKLRAKTAEWCSSTPPNEDRGLPAWDLTGTTAWKDNPTGEPKGRIIWAGDINGDGIGDLIFGWDDIWRDLSMAGMDGHGMPTVRWKAFSVTLGCGRLGDYREIFGWNSDLEGQSAYEAELTGSDLDISVGVVEKPRSTIRSVCIYPTKKIKCTRSKCNNKPEECADLSRWKNAEKGEVRQ